MSMSYGKMIKYSHIIVSIYIIAGLTKKIYIIAG